jgi:hypothetical protein
MSITLPSIYNYAHGPSSTFVKDPATNAVCNVGVLEGSGNPVTQFEIKKVSGSFSGSGNYLLASFFYFI